MGTNHAKQQQTFKTLGLAIDFPFMPYGTQRAMMNKITSTLCNKEHSLIESPTGTGKTLVLLCSSLAWQKKSKELAQPFISARLRQLKKEQKLNVLRNKECTCPGQMKDYNDDCKKLKKDDDIIIIEDEEDEKQKCERCRAISAEETYQAELGQSLEGDSADVVGKVSCRIPRIYYGTRTHKQITQVIRELNKTTYNKGLKMCILSSRERTCINEDVRYESDRNERCQSLINNNSSSRKKTDEPTCRFYTDSNTLRVLYDEINNIYSEQAWDIEELTKFGTERGGCPYFGVRKLQEEADITFCPYNYLLDPTIRSNLNINIKDAVVIIDEAHNLEDICRDSASFIIDTRQIDNIMETISKGASHYLQGSQMHDAYTFFRDKFNRMRYFLNSFKFADADRDPFDKSERKILTKGEMLDELDKLGLGQNNIADIKLHLKTLRGDDEDENKPSQEEVKDAALNSNQLQSIRQLCITLDFMYSADQKKLMDFRAVVTKQLDREPARFGPRRNLHQSVDQMSDNQVYIWQLSILCMNPAVAFEKIHQSAWSVIVASGTLSPIESLKTELGCTFSQPFEGGHVISQDRIFASIISHGPNRKELNCAYTNSQKLEFQDEVGYVVRDICCKVPKGVLCFFPSYDRMEVFIQRWTAKGILREIEASKGSIFKEQKKQTAQDFEKVLTKYHKRASGKGALLMAVFRGKVSEGIDFADDAARAVITIGIPYPNVREVSVGLKKEYNDQIRKASPQIMPGGEWYACQAFRALNQALGRCIRHKDDWGSIILIDSRLKSPYSSKNLSKWLQNNLTSSNDYNEISDKLDEFVSNRNRDL